MQRREQERLTQLTQGLQQLLGLGMAIVPAVFLALQAEAYAHVGQYATALQQLDEALTLTDTTGRRAWEAELYRLKGTVLLGLAGAEGLTDSSNAPIAEAEACYRQALTIAHRQAARSWELRAALSLSRLWQQHGRQTEAHQLLTPVYDGFTEGASTPDLQDACAMLEALA